MSDNPVEGVVNRLRSRIREEREDQGLSVTELSEKSGVGRATVSDLERTARTPSLDTLAKIAAGLGVPMPDLFAERPAHPHSLVENVAGLDATLLGVWEEGGDRVEVHRLSVSMPVRRRPIRPGARGYLTVVSGTVSAGSAATPRKLSTGGQLAYAADQPHIIAPIGGPAQVVLVMRYPVEG